MLCLFAGCWVSWCAHKAWCWWSEGRKIPFRRLYLFKNYLWLWWRVEVVEICYNFLDFIDLIFVAQSATKTTFLAATIRKCSGNEEKGKTIYNAYGSNGQVCIFFTCNMLNNISIVAILKCRFFRLTTYSISFTAELNTNNLHLWKSLWRKSFFRHCSL